MKKTLTTMLLTVSLIINSLFIYNRLEKQVYKVGRKEGHQALYKKIVNQVLTKGNLTVETPRGKVLLVPQTRPKKQVQPSIEAVKPAADPNVLSESEK